MANFNELNVLRRGGDGKEKGKKQLCSCQKMFKLAAMSLALSGGHEHRMH